MSNEKPPGRVPGGVAGALAPVTGLVVLVTVGESPHQELTPSLRTGAVALGVVDDPVAGLVAENALDKHV